MRVLQLGKYYYPYMGGIENHLYLLCNELKNEVDLDVLVCNSRRVSSIDDVGGVRVTRCYEVTNVASTSICPTMPLEVAQRSYDLIHFHFPHPMGVMSYLLGAGARRAGKHAVVVTYHGDIVKQEQLLKLYRPFMNRVLDRADVILCTSPDYRDGSDFLVPYREKCRVLPYGIDLDQFQRTPQLEKEAAAIRARFKGRPLVLGVGRLIYYKGFEYAVRALKDTDAELLLVGTGHLREMLEQTARECGVAERVHFLGEIHNQDLAPYYYASDVYALPSIARSEAFAIVQLEAMACGLPVVNTAIPRSGVPFVSRDGESGLTVPPKDAEAFAGALRTILGDRDLARRFGEAGRERVRREFSKEVMGQRMLALYREVTAPLSAAAE
ncbi:MAG TPA: glycosyltransferase [Polyangiaceae bacterium]|jgi:rhamnosyl/mannosyltransferase